MRNSRTPHELCWEQLPWLVNGSLPAEKQARIEQHLNDCSECLQEFQLQTRLQAQLCDGDAVLLAPQASWQKMNERLEQEQNQNFHGGSIKERAVKRRAFSGLQLAFAAQALVIIGLLTALGMQARNTRLNESPIDIASNHALPAYETLTSAVEPTAGQRQSNAEPNAELRVVFQRATPIAEVNQLLQALPAQIVSGPSEAGVYVLALPNAASQASALLQQLRNDKRVIFAEAQNATKISDQLPDSAANGH